MDTSMATKGAFLFDVVPIGYNPHTRIGNPVRILAPPNIISSASLRHNGQSDGIIGYNVAKQIPNESPMTPNTMTIESVSTMTMDSVSECYVPGNDASITKFESADTLLSLGILQPYQKMILKMRLLLYSLLCFQILKPIL